MSPTSARHLRRRFSGLADSAAKQIALRRIRDAIALEKRDDPATQALAAELLASAAYYLPMAEEISRRHREPFNKTRRGYERRQERRFVAAHVNEPV